MLTKWLLAWLLSKHTVNGATIAAVNNMVKMIEYTEKKERFSQKIHSSTEELQLVTDFCVPIEIIYRTVFDIWKFVRGYLTIFYSVGIYIYNKKVRSRRKQQVTFVYILFRT